MIDRRDRSFNDKLALILVSAGIIGALLVLIDPVFAITLKNGFTLHIGGSGFSDQMKGAVITMILVGGFTAVITYYFGSSNADKVKNETISNLAATVAPTPLNNEPPNPPTIEGDLT